MKLCLACDHHFDRPSWECSRCGHAPPQRDGFVAFAPELAAGNDGFEPEAFAALAAVEAESFWFEGRNRLLWWALGRYFPAASNFLEVGCGTGFVLGGLRQAAPRLRLFGSEVYFEGLAFARRRVPEATLFQMDARRIPFRDEFDVVGAFDVLEHVEDDRRVLAEMFAACRPGGGLILTVPQHRFLWSAFDEYAQHKRRYSRRELAGKVVAVGFQLLYLGSFCSLLLPVMLLSRLRHRRLVEGYDPVAELKLNPVVNGLFRRALDVERGLIRAGVRFPWGGSLLAVAKKGPGS
jgi:SAM-dependent methyltransferase